MRRIPGNPLAGVLRATARAARSTTRRSVAIPGPEGPQGEPGPTGPAAPGVAAHATAVLETDSEGVAAWTYPETADVPVIIATTAGFLPVLVTVAEVTETGAVLVAWTLGGERAPDVLLHVVAYGVATPMPETTPDTIPVD